MLRSVLPRLIFELGICAPRGQPWISDQIRGTRPRKKRAARRFRVQNGMGRRAVIERLGARLRKRTSGKLLESEPVRVRSVAQIAGLGLHLPPGVTERPIQIRKGRRTVAERGQLGLDASRARLEEDPASACREVLWSRAWARTESAHPVDAARRRNATLAVSQASGRARWTPPGIQLWTMRAQSFWAGLQAEAAAVFGWERRHGGA